MNKEMDAKKLFRKYGPLCISVVGIAMIFVGTKATVKARKAVANVDKAIDKLADATPVDISDSIIKAAAEKAADKAAEEGVEKVRKDINSKVYNTVSSAYENVENEIRDKLSSSIERDVDMDELKKKVENKASSAIVEKFINDLSSYADPIMSHIMGAAARKEKA